MNEIIEDIIQALCHVKGMQYVSLDRGQADPSRDDRPPLKFPAVLVSLENAQITPVCKDQEAQEINIRLQLVDAVGVVASNGAPARHHDRALSTLLLRPKIEQTMGQLGFFPCRCLFENTPIGLNVLSLFFVKRIYKARP